jgi:hypothetical protein
MYLYDIHVVISQFPAKVVDHSMIFLSLGFMVFLLFYFHALFCSLQTWGEVNKKDTININGSVSKEKYYRFFII